MSALVVRILVIVAVAILNRVAPMVIHATKNAFLSQVEADAFAALQAFLGKLKASYSVPVK